MQNLAKNILSLVVLALISFQTSAAVGPGHAAGPITNITSVKQGLLIRIGANEVPENCTSGNAWMLVEEQYKTIISLAITAWTLGKSATVYTDATASGYCKINQVDPSES